MYVISAYSDNMVFLAAVNYSLSRQMDECSIRTTACGNTVFVSKGANKKSGAFIASNCQEDAIDLALQGIPVLDIDRIIDSMEDVDRDGFARAIEFELVGDENLVAQAIRVRLEDSLSDPTMMDQLLPVRYGAFRTPILQPAEFQLLQNSEPFKLNVTIRSRRTVINQLVGRNPEL